MASHFTNEQIFQFKKAFNLWHDPDYMSPWAEDTGKWIKMENG